MSSRLSRVPELRRAARTAVGEGTLRRVSRDIGLSAPAVRNFINGAEPRRPATLRKLESWYVRRLAETATPTDVDSVRSALAILLRDLPEEQQADIAAATLIFLREQYTKYGISPAWLAAAQAEIAANR